MSEFKVALYGKKTTSSSLVDFMPEFIAKLKEKGIQIQIEKEFYNVLQSIPEIEVAEYTTFEKHKDLWSDLDLFFTFGGDGTILAAVTLVQDSNVPIVGVNTGRLGYLASINKKELLPNLEEILQKNVKVSERSLLEAELIGEGRKLTYPFALNELTIMRKETTSMITVDTYVNGELLNYYWADGLIIATPTGSTGYSLSCNGPIISPENHNFVITPIAPHNLNVRPIIIADKESLHLKIHSRASHYSLSLDSRMTSLSTETEIEVRRSPFQIKIVELKENSYLKTLRKKLYWGSDQRNTN